jgi:hypothetical protein
MSCPVDEQHCCQRRSPHFLENTRRFSDWG